MKDSSDVQAQSPEIDRICHVTKTQVKARKTVFSNVNLQGLQQQKL